MARILIIEDDPTIRIGVLRALADRGHAVSSATTAMDGLRLAVADRPEVILLDLGLPDLDGREMLRMLRAVSQVPVIVATARRTEGEMVLALDAGADDYVVKPYGADQIDARIRAMLRRVGAASRPRDATVRVGQLSIDPRSRVATLSGEPLSLTPREFELLHYLAVRSGDVISKRDLMAEVWQMPYTPGDKTVDVHLSWLRRKLGESAQQPRYLHTIHRVGVRLSPPPDAEGDSPGGAEPA